MDLLLWLSKIYVDDPVKHFPFLFSSCLQYEYLPVDKYRCVFGTEVTFFLHGGEYRKTTFQQPTVKHPVMSHINGQEVRYPYRTKLVT